MTRAATRATPESPAAALGLGHEPVWDPPAAMTAAERWTCECGATVLRYGRNVYGTATTQPCPRPADEPVSIADDDASAQVQRGRDRFAARVAHLGGDVFATLPAVPSDEPW